MTPKSYKYRVWIWDLRFPTGPVVTVYTQLSDRGVRPPMDAYADQVGCNWGDWEWREPGRCGVYSMQRWGQVQNIARCALFVQREDYRKCGE